MSVLHEINEKISLRESKISELQNEVSELKKRNKDSIIPTLLDGGLLAGSVWKLYKNRNHDYTSYLKKISNGTSSLGELDKALEKVSWSFKEKLSDSIEIEIQINNYRYGADRHGLDINFKWNNVQAVADFVRKHGMIVDYSNNIEEFNKLKEEISEIDSLFKLNNEGSNGRTIRASGVQ